MSAFNKKGGKTSIFLLLWCSLKPCLLNYLPLPVTSSQTSSTSHVKFFKENLFLVQKSTTPVLHRYLSAFLQTPSLDFSLGMVAGLGTYTFQTPKSSGNEPRLQPFVKSRLEMCSWFLEFFCVLMFNCAG